MLCGHVLSHTLLPYILLNSILHWRPISTAPAAYFMAKGGKVAR